MNKMPRVHKQGKWLWGKVYYLRSEKWIVILERKDELFLERLERMKSMKKWLKPALMQLHSLNDQSLWTWQPRFAAIS